MLKLGLFLRRMCNVFFFACRLAALLTLTRENSRVVTEAGSELRSLWPHVVCTFRLAQPAKPLRVESGRD